MALNYDFKDVENSDEVCWIWRDFDPRADGEWTSWHRDKRRVHKGRNQVCEMNPLTHSLIMVMMVIQMGEITAKNTKEFFIRVRIYENLMGALVTRREDAYDGDESGSFSTKFVDVLTTPDDIKAHIGLRTNVATSNRPKFTAHILKVAAGSYSQLFDAA